MSTTKTQKLEQPEQFPNPKNLKFSKVETDLLTQKFADDPDKFLHTYQKILEEKKKKSETFTPKISLTPKNKLPIGTTNMKSLVGTIIPPSSTNIRLGEVNFEGKRKSQSNTFENVTITESGLNEVLGTSAEVVNLFVDKLRSFADAKERKTIQIPFVTSVITQTFPQDIANHLLHNMKERLAKYKESFESNEQAEESTVESEQEQETDAHTVISDEDNEPSSNEDEDPSSGEDKNTNKESDKMTIDSSNSELQNTQKEPEMGDESLVRDD